MNAARAIRIWLLVVAAALLIAHITAAVRQLERPLMNDENEYLHAAWLMRDGAHIYSDFMEDHPPFLFRGLALLAPTQPTREFPLVDVLTWTIRGRIAMAICGLIGLACCGGVAWRITRDPVAPLLCCALILGSLFTWANGLADIRNDAPTLALFWAGALLVLELPQLRISSALRIGIGLALLVVVSAWNPKWPLESIVVGVVFLRHVFAYVKARRVALIVAAIVPSLIAVAAVVAVISAEASIRDYIFFNFSIKAESMRLFTQYDWVTGFFRNAPPLAFTAVWFRWIAVIIVVAVIAVGIVRKALPSDAFIAIALAAASCIEVRFLYSYPYLWPQYLLMFAMTLALVYAMLPSIVERIVPDERMARVIAIGVAVVLFFVLMKPMRLVTTPSGRTLVIVAMIGAIVPVIFALVLPKQAIRAAAASTALALAFVGLAAIIGGPARRIGDSYWSMLSYFQHELRPGETVWFTTPLHPIGARDATYYWYSRNEIAPLAMRLRNSSDADLPPCAALRGANRSIRFIEANTLQYLGQSCACMSELIRSGAAVPTPYAGVFDLRPSAARGPLPKWFTTRQASYLDLCRSERK